jgi:hypothetical protein
MARKQVPSSELGEGQRTQSSGLSASRNLEQLRRRFAEFRRQHPPATRIPDGLRNPMLGNLRNSMALALTLSGGYLDQEAEIRVAF